MNRTLLSILSCLLLLAPSLAQDRKLLLGGGKPSPAALSDFVTDSFNEASDTTLASHTGELGATWTKHPGASYTSTATVDAATDRVYPLGTTAYYASGAPPSADYYAQVDFFAASIVSVNIAVCVRMDTTADTMYLLRLNNGTAWELRKIVAGNADDQHTEFADCR